MIEMMLEAERAMGVGLIDKAERFYAQVVASDPHNSIAVTGLARVALERGDQRGAYLYARRALALDRDNPVAGHLAHRMAEQFLIRGEPLPDEATDGPAESATGTASSAPATLSGGLSGGSTPPPGPSVAPDPAEPSAGPGLVDRLLRRRR